MPIVPDTSTTLLRDLANDPRHVRWTEFVNRYRPMMEAYLRGRFPALDAEEIVAETLIALVEVLKDYRYDPAESGRFHNYLTGILRHKALRIRRANARDEALRERLGAESGDVSAPMDDEAEEESYRQSLFEIALSQFLADESVAPRTKEVFRRVAMAGEPPEAVARSFLIARHAVDQIKSRSIAHLREIVRGLERADDGR